MLSLIDIRSLFRLYTFYTVLLAIILLTLYLLDDTLRLWQPAYPKLLPLILSAYGALGGINIATAYIAPWNASDKLTPNFLAEVLIVGTILLFIAPHQEELGLVLIVTVALANLTLTRKMGFLVAAMASILMLTHSAIHERETGSSLLFENTLLSTLFFFEAMLLNLFQARLNKAEVDVRNQRNALRMAARMNDLIIDRMRTGVCVLKSSGKPISHNKAAKERLAELENLKLPDAVYERFMDWLQSREQNESPVLIPETGQKLLISFSSIDSDVHVAFIDDLRVVTQKAQQLKLASLGRMAASIAHEIRNPLSAISHASQLLQESPHLDQDDQRMCQIITHHIGRVDMVIQNVLQISKRKKSEPQPLALLPWLTHFQQEFQQHHHADIRISGPSQTVSFDPSQLHQITWNLCENVLKHASEEKISPILIRIGKNQDGRAFLRLCDRGPGIPADEQPYLFEPFHTTSAKGTGLGLYIVKELCEANHSEIRYDGTQSSGACFEILFAFRQRNPEVTP